MLEHEILAADKALSGEESRVWGDAVHRDIEKRDKHNIINTDWNIVMHHDLHIQISEDNP